jgi:translation elongation factor P/translation initiation factor 5A
MSLKTLAKLYQVVRGDEKVERAWKLVREAARYSNREPYWEFLKRNFDVRAEDIKDALRFLEENGELQIKRSIDGKRLYVSTLKDIRENPVRLDRWLRLT